ncbi:tocopherol cyclase family protein [Acetobacterium sp.]|jgi:tocopherol cyclase|uniref:tocopherol cyclase family protein n=1 Tax=Acetobacterium sp. TaxID=1872094 RepID=UPI002F41F1D5
MSNVWKPEAFQGKGKKENYFEGWYFKSVSKDEKTAYAVILGISVSRNKTISHSFVMLVDAAKQKLYYFQYPISEFWGNTKKFEVKIGRNYFSLESIKLDMDDGKDKIKADLKIANIYPWPVALLSPGTMGWYAFVPMMECYHATASFDHSIEGHFDVNGIITDFTGGKGYLEKDWGRSMPSSWIWMQTNHFDEDGVSLFGSIAKIPWLGSFFTGFIFGFYYKKHIYRFATYTGAEIQKLNVSPGRIEIIVKDKKYTLEISADRTEGIDLPAPKLGEMTAKVNESLKSKILVRFYRKGPNGNELLFSGVGRSAGLEFVGNIQELISGFAKPRKRG